ncbi:MAG: T9SS type A sorting domain-containing protein [Bacteroidetes bacterium]|nr:T9SS type A sorting domain-containing protein [Bacteroidota bacterium]
MHKRQLLSLVTFGIFVILCTKQSYAANYYWVGNGGNWTDLTHWANSSGGTGSAYGTVPSTSDNVYFDANSFSAGSATVTINSNVSCANLDFTGTTNTPTFKNASATDTITCAGSLTLISAITYSFVGTYNFTGTGTHTITNAGKTLGTNILFNGTGGQWTLQDAFICTGQLGLQAGTLVCNSMAVRCSTLNANIVDNTRTLNFGGSAVSITGSGTAMDLRGNTSNLTVSSTTVAVVTFSNTTSSVTVEVGLTSKTIPNLLFVSSTQARTINSTSTYSTSDRITFRDITVTGSGSFNITGAGNATNAKTFEDITISTSTTFTIGGANGTGWENATVSKITGVFTATACASGYFYGDYLQFDRKANMEYSTGTATGTFDDKTLFKDSIWTRRNSNIYFYDSTIITKSFLMGDYSTSRIRYDKPLYIGEDLVFNGAWGGANGQSIMPVTTSSLTINGNVFAYNFGSNVTIGGGSGSTSKYTINGTVYVKNCTMQMTSTGSNPFTIANLHVDENAYVFFARDNGTLPVTTITGTITSSGACSSTNQIGAGGRAGGDARVSLTNTVTVSNLSCRYLNITTNNLILNNGTDLGSNTGITFNSYASATTYYWVGGTTGNTKTGTYSLGNNNYWTNPDNWSLSSGVYTATNQCVPGTKDNVVFDANSFSSGSNMTADLNTLDTHVNDFTWSGVPSGTYFDQGFGSTGRFFYIYGNFTYPGANLTDRYEGLVLLASATSKTITTNGTDVYAGSFETNGVGGSWTLADNLTLSYPSGGNLRISTGTLTAGSNTISLTGAMYAGSNTFNAGTSTVRFNGSTSNTSVQSIDRNGGTGWTTLNFYNLEVARTNGTGNANTLQLSNFSVTVSNNLTITSGRLYDNGLQIGGNVTGTLSIASGARLVLGKTGTSTLFPTNYTASKISLNSASIVTYSSSVAQTVSGVPDYGTLELANGTTTSCNKSLNEAVVITGSLLIGAYNNFKDMGYQITGNASGSIDMDANSTLTIGSALNSSSFPTLFTNIDFEHSGNGSTVVYNAFDPQTVKGLSGTAPANYSHLTINGGGVGTLDGNTTIRGNLTITSSTLDASGSNHSISIGGNWLNSGTFTAQAGTTTFNGSAAAQTIGGSSSTSFYNLTLNNSYGTAPQIVLGVTGNSVSNTLTMTSGIVNMATYTFIIGSSAGSPGTLSYTAGYFYGGTLKRWFATSTVADGNTSAGLFPLGTATYGYAPMYVSCPSTAPSTGGSISISYTDPFTSSIVSFVDGASTVVRRNNQVWAMSTANGLTGGTYNLLAQRNFNATLVGNINDLRLTQLGSVVGTHGTNAGTVLTPQVQRTGLTLANLTNDFYISSVDKDNSPLPIKLLSFTAQNRYNQYAQLNWTTATETNNDYFTIEKTQDGISFEQVAIVTGAGNSAQTLHYSITDPKPYMGISYYRLQQTDFDGKFTYSQLASVEFESLKLESSRFNIFPNPANYNNLNVSFDGQLGQEVLIVVHDVLGKEYYSKAFVLENELLITQLTNGNHLPTGLYTITATSNDKLYSKKVVVK